MNEQVLAESAVCLKEVLDRVPIPFPGEIPGPESTSLPERWKLPGTDIDLIQQKQGPFTGEYLFSAHTVINAPRYYKRIREQPFRTSPPTVSKGLIEWYRYEPATPLAAWIVDRLPDGAKHRIAMYALWQWVGIVVVFVGGLGLMALIYRLGRMRAERFRTNNLFRYVITLVFPLTNLLIPLGMKWLLRRDLMVVGGFLRVTDFLLGLVFLLALLRLIWASGNRLLVGMLNHPRFVEKQLDAQFIRLVGRVLTIVTVVIVFLEGGKRLGIPLSTLLAGAGISGLAIALAAQDSLKNILGSVMLILDKPFEVGDRILVKTFDGVVKEIGLRSTKLQLMTGHGASIPNEVLARLEVENVSRRPHIRRVLNLHIPLTTPADRMEQCVQRIQERLRDHEGQPEDKPPLVFFADILEHAHVLRIIYWYAPPKSLDLFAFSERFNLDLMRILEEEGISLQRPLQMTALPKPV